MKTSRARGIHSHKCFKLGRANPRRDKRNLRFGDVLQAVKKLPASYDFDLAHTGIPTPMFANDVYGDCVIAGRAHQTLRFERIEQGSTLMISDKDVTREYLSETGGADTGLIVLDSLKLWRTKGWSVGTLAHSPRSIARARPKYARPSTPTLASGSAFAYRFLRRRRSTLAGRGPSRPEGTRRPAHGAVTMCT